ncbi:hypothetical protein [Chryseobacterium luquanense]|uniref:Leucine-rich repeat domain-containing protein n=1 Tax=Chryseobacterium luquanense TaxID=2983766 RepID=A0ABT3Y7W9_9FLAO|nr:hypothetical protein [Chryseobacterium luquanense]MCX8534266.1 hypothetical protein [Chryseobacterium luquanense]
MALKKFKINTEEKIKRITIDKASDYDEIDFTAMASVEELWISSKKDYYIPVELAFLKNLKRLGVSNHCHLPENIDQFKSLEELSLSHEAIYNVPDSIKKTTSIKELQIIFYPKNTEPQISPEWIFDVKRIETLSITVSNFSEIKINSNNTNQLKEIDFSSSLSGLKVFPDLSSLKNVKKLNLSAEPVIGQKMPGYELFGQMLDSIKDLNQIEELDLSFWRPKKKSDRLVIRDGKVSIPDIFDRFPNLFRLSIADMKIDFIPESILGLKKLRELQIQGNNFDKDEIAKIKTSLSYCGIQNYH